MTVKWEVRTITPEEALAMLERNTNNRTLRWGYVETLARDMKAGKWVFNGDAIRLNGSNNIMDGQHRLHACVRSGKSFQTIVITGLTDSAHATIDTGAKRTLGDELKWMGKTNVNNLAAVIALVWHYDNNRTAMGQGGISRAESLTLLRRQPDIEESLVYQRGGRDLGLMGSAYSAACHLLRREHGKEMADEFTTHLTAGTDYTDDDPCLALRNYALSARMRTLYRPSRVDWMAVTIKTMNYYLMGRPLKNLRWRRAGKSKEDFPTLLTKQDIGD